MESGADDTLRVIDLSTVSTTLNPHLVFDGLSVLFTDTTLPLLCWGRDPESRKVTNIQITGVARPSGAHGQGTVKGPKTILVGGPTRLSGPLDIVDPVHPLPTPLIQIQIKTFLLIF